MSRDLGGASLGGANLTGANLSGTCLDRRVPIPRITDEQILAANLQSRLVRGRERLYGRRTSRSLYFGAGNYTVPGWHRAVALSVDRSTKCHPGIYLGGSDVAGRDDLVTAWCYRDEAVYVSPAKGVRTRRLWSVGGNNDHASI